MEETQKCFTEEYVARVVHDLKTPVLSIGGYARRLHEEKLGPLNKGQKEALEIILQTSERLEHDLAWIIEHAMAGKFVWEEAYTRRVDLRELVEKTAEAVRALAERNDQEVELEMPENPLEVEADPAMMERSVSELIRNALKHSFKGGRVTVTLTEKHGMAEISVIDHGEGFDPKKLELVFQPWEQVVQIEDRRIRGVGIGLANVKSYAEAHGGEIRAETSPGEGSTFRLLLPTSREDLE